MTLDKDALIRAIQAHPGYNPDNGQCPGGDDWCVDAWLAMTTPGFGGSAMTKAMTAVFVGFTWIGLRVWAAVGLAIPYLLGYKARVVVVEGQASLRLVRRGVAVETKVKKTR